MYKPDPSLTVISSNGSCYVCEELTKIYKHFSGGTSDSDEDIINRNHL